ncbi:hypothetical protein CN393_07930 [Bacillus cereus]|nr:hypothetical protein CN393_07930 [Bacillus cereus]
MTGPPLVLSSGFFFNTGPGSTQAIAVNTSVPLAGGSSNVVNITINGTNTVVTLGNTGVYLISYGVNVATQNGIATVQILQNGLLVPGTNINVVAGFTGNGFGMFGDTFLLSATAGDTVEIRNTATTLSLAGNLTNAFLNIVQIK